VEETPTVKDNSFGPLSDKVGFRRQPRVAIGSSDVTVRALAVHRISSHVPFVAHEAAGYKVLILLVNLRATFDSVSCPISIFTAAAGAGSASTVRVVFVDGLTRQALADFPCISSLHPCSRFALASDHGRSRLSLRSFRTWWLAIWVSTAAIENPVNNMAPARLSIRDF
jgi:hypothetical protein